MKLKFDFVRFKNTAESAFFPTPTVTTDLLLISSRDYQFCSSCFYRQKYILNEQFVLQIYFEQQWLMESKKYEEITLWPERKKKQKKHLKKKLTATVNI